MGIIGSCLGSCAATACCSLSVNSKTAKWPFIVFIFVNVILAIVMSFWGAEELGTIAGYDITLCPSQENADYCLGNSSVFRISFAMAIFFGVHALVSFFWLGCHQLCWPLKIVFYVGGLAATFFVEQDVFETYAQIARVVSVFFILAQVILLIDFSYSWNEAWVEGDNKFYYGAIVVISIVSYIAAIVFWSLMFVYFTDSAGGGCHNNKTFISLTIIFCVAFTAISISEWCEHGAILPSAVVTLYATFVLYSALSSDPTDCNTLVPENGSASQWLGLVIAAFAIGYAGYNVSSQSHKLFGGGNSDDEALTGDSPAQNSSAAATADDDIEEGAKKKKEEDLPEDSAEVMTKEQDAEARKQASVFHVVMLCAAMYMAMVLSNWGVDTAALSGDDVSDDDIAEALTLSTTSVWVKIASQWCTVLLYVWTLVAPYIFTNRSFS